VPPAAAKNIRRNNAPRERVRHNGFSAGQTSTPDLRLNSQLENKHPGKTLARKTATTPPDGFLSFAAQRTTAMTGSKRQDDAEEIGYSLPTI
jgi:hypothetical protein